MGFQGYLSSLEALGDSEEEEEENALLFHESVEMGGLVSVLPTPSCAGKCENSGLDISVLDHYKNYTKAFSGPFFIAENSYSKSRGMDFYAFFKPFI